MGQCECVLEVDQVTRELRLRLERDDPAAGTDCSVHPVGINAEIRTHIHHDFAVQSLPQQKADAAALGSQAVAPEPVSHAKSVDEVHRCLSRRTVSADPTRSPGFGPAASSVRRTAICVAGRMDYNAGSSDNRADAPTALQISAALPPPVAAAAVTRD